MSSIDPIKTFYSQEIITRLSTCLEQGPVESLAATAVGINDSRIVTKWNDFLANLDCQKTKLQLGTNINYIVLFIHFIDSS